MYGRAGTFARYGRILSSADNLIPEITLHGHYTTRKDLMIPAPVISVDEFTSHTISSTENDTYREIVREHPDLGRWEERTVDYSYFKISEHKTTLNQPIYVTLHDPALTDHVNHCMCVDGSLGTHFDDFNLKAYLNPGTFHYMTVQANEYSLAMSRCFRNIHVQIDRRHYTDLLGDDEAWSARLKESILTNEVTYPGEFDLTPAMFKTIFDIFGSPLTGSLKRLLIEGKMLELIALQLDTSRMKQAGKNEVQKNTDLLFAIREYLDNSFLEDHSMKGICQRFGINEFALKNGFKKTFRTTVFEFILSRRLEYARELLQQADHTVQEIGTMVGYKYPNHFSTAFKNKFGISPGKLGRCR